MPRLTNKPGILIIHGFTGSPADARELTAYLERTLGAQVAVPQLPGHGTQPEDLFRVTADDWYATVKNAYDQLAAHHQRVAIIGISFGANLMLKLASERRPAALVGLGTPARLRHHWLIRTGVKFMKLFTKTYVKKGDFRNEHIPDYRQSAYDRIPLVALEEFLRFLERHMTPAILARVTAPVLLIQSSIDPIVAPGSAQFFGRYLGSTVQEFRMRDHQRHLLIQGPGKQELFTEIVEFLNPHLDKSAR